MSSNPEQPNPPDEAQIRQWIDPIADRFDAAWVQALGGSPPPRIEEHLGDCIEPYRSALLRDLIAVELEYRCRHNEEPKLDDYHQRFPDLDLNWLARQITVQAQSEAGKGTGEVQARSNGGESGSGDLVSAPDHGFQRMPAVLVTTPHLEREFPSPHCAYGDCLAYACEP